MSEPQSNNPLHGATQKAIVEDRVGRRGWADLGWARAEVERRYLDDQRRAERNRQPNRRRAARRAERSAAT